MCTVTILWYLVQSDDDVDDDDGDNGDENDNNNLEVLEYPKYCTCNLTANPLSSMQNCLKSTNYFCFTNITKNNIIAPFCKVCFHL